MFKSNFDLNQKMSSQKRKSGEEKRWKWGIMSAGRIANDFVLALQHEM